MEQNTATEARDEEGVGRIFVQSKTIAVPAVRGLVFTQREIQVMIGMARGLANKEIGAHIGLKSNTVKTYVRRVFKKTGVGSRSALVSWGYQHDLFQGLKTHPMMGTGDKLSAREVEMTRLVILGLTNKEIGRRVFLSEDTVKTHLRRTFKKTGAKDRAHLITLAWQHNLVPRDAWQESDGTEQATAQAG